MGLSLNAKQNTSSKAELWLYLFSTFGYFAQGSLYESGSLVSRLFLIIILLISLKNFLVSIQLPRKLMLFNALTFLVVILTIYILFGPTYSDLNNFDQLKGIYLSMMSFYVAYVYTLKGKISESILSLLLISFLATNILSYYNFIDYYNASNSRHVFAGEITNNTGYKFVFLFPLICLLNRKRVIKYVAFALICFFCFMSAKRGAIVLALLCVIITVYSILKSREVKRNLLLKLLLLIGFALGLIVLYNNYLDNPYLQSRFNSTMEGNSSGRDILFGQILSYLFSFNQNWYNYLFGSGYGATTAITGGYFAHNDWLELAVDLGALGILTYFVFYVSIIKYYFKNIKNQSLEISSAFLTTILILIVTSVVSMSFMDEGHIIVFFILGYIIANIKNNNAARSLKKMQKKC